MADQQTPTRPGAPSDPRPPDPNGPRPWRTEGLPKDQPDKKRPRWTWAAWGLAYLLLFGLLTLQDRMAGPIVVPYTEFKAQVAKGNVTEVFARGNTIQGALKQPAPRNSLDALTRSMVERGRQMSGRYKQASLGGIAINIADC